MKILFIGDTVGRAGRRIISTVLPNLKKKHEPLFVIQNAENLAGGMSTTEKTLKEMESYGVDFFTGGNHSFQNAKLYDHNRHNIIRPVNLEDGAPGIGSRIIKRKGEKLGIVNLLGRVFMKIPALCPFRTMEKILHQWEHEDLEGIFVDFHAETTSEKAAFFHHFRKKITALIGTHTHIPTADGKIWKGGTYFQTDIGMTGPVESIIGLKLESGIENFLSPTGRKKFEPALGPSVFRGVLLDISKGKTQNFKEIEIFEETL